MPWLAFAVAADVAAITATILFVEPTPFLVVPAIAALLPLVVRTPVWAVRARIAATVLLAAFTILGLMTVGLLFLPSALAMGAAAAAAQAAFPAEARS